MLEELLRSLNNWFLVPDGIYPDTYDVKGGNITLPFLQDGQYFRIVGSVFNDGLYRRGYTDTDLTDESFRGAVWALAVPKEVVSLAGEIASWREKYEAIVCSPYTSESVTGMYSYTKAGSGMSGAGITGWKDVFRQRMNRWRKLS